MSDTQASDRAMELAKVTGGTSGGPIYELVARLVAERGNGGVLADVGCGTGALRAAVATRCSHYVGVDLVKYDTFPPECEFHPADLNAADWPVPAASADVVCAVETIEHLENPRAFLRQLVRVAKPGGLVIATTPNQLSWLSLLALLMKGYFSAFAERPGLYPSHITALLESDLVRIAREVGLRDVRIDFTNSGRMPGTARHWPRLFRGRRFSDNIAISGIVAHVRHVT